MHCLKPSLHPGITPKESFAIQEDTLEQLFKGLGFPRLTYRIHPKFTLTINFSDWTTNLQTLAYTSDCPLDTIYHPPESLFNFPEPMETRSLNCSMYKQRKPQSVIDYQEKKAFSTLGADLFDLKNAHHT
eukprot:1142488-Pelagomonas_calceolata.AAC.2